MLETDSGFKYVLSWTFNCSVLQFPKFVTRRQLKYLPHRVSVSFKGKDFNKRWPRYYMSQHSLK